MWMTPNTALRLQHVGPIQAADFYGGVTAWWLKMRSL
jgi:hypothetical protein